MTLGFYFSTKKQYRNINNYANYMNLGHTVQLYKYYEVTRTYLLVKSKF